MKISMSIDSTICMQHFRDFFSLLDIFYVLQISGITLQ